MSEPRAFRSIGIIGQRRYPNLGAALDSLAALAERNDLELFVDAGLADLLPSASEFRPGRTDLLLTFGGDGTLLSGARMVAPHGTPVLGVNMGHLGFLTSVYVHELEDALNRVLSGDFWLDRRFTLEVEVELQQGDAEPAYVALNDAVLHKGGFARVIRIAVMVGDDAEEVGTYSADGIIISTPTGSTAYSMSAGGAIVVPSVECILATPICPHTLAVRPLVLPADSQVTVEVREPSEEVVLTIDGQEGEPLSPGDRLTVRRGKASVSLVRFEGQSFFSTLRRKLNWGVNAPEQLK
ncbi:MAG: NAD(+)/NADH kinase [Gemmatimonadota bacterium]|jgi:NAD+ kinase